MSVRCRELGVNLSRETLDFCPTASATGDFRSTVEIDFEPLRAQLREALTRDVECGNASCRC